uniref:Efflux pump DEP3 (Depudecin biosynthesis cluster protein 3) n=1 Tax=Ganoderma boninense TaxID=34458 RepID=A0A5K1K3X0_9APHY|nr:Efflux pump DEP3 (Depudecin biosynthesis cluster protein 3) [Ganoderma boninense]
MSESTSTTTPPLYLNPTTGDLIIRTPNPDSTDFHVHRCIIANLSPVFADMFSLPAPGACDTAGPDKPVVDVQEPAAVWTHILSFCHFAPRPSSLTIDDVHALLEAARKYQMPGVTDWMRRTLADEFVDKQPLSAFGLACAYKLDDLARRAARASLLLPANFAFVKELDLIPTRQYHRLLEYRRRCLSAARTILSWESGSWRSPSWLSDMSDIGRYNRALHVLRSLNKPSKLGPHVGREYQVNDAWRVGMEALCKSMETQLRPSSTFCPLLLEPLVQACVSTSSYGELEDIQTIVSRAHKFALLLDDELKRVVELELDNDK